MVHPCDPAADYVPRNPAETVLYKVVAEQLETFLAKQRRRERSVPCFAEDPTRHDGCGAESRSSPQPGCRHPRNYTWAELMRRVFELDVLVCDRCGGRMRILAAIHSPEAIRGILDYLGLPTRAPLICPALPDEEDFAADQDFENQ